MKTPGYFEPSVYYDKETGGIYYSDGRYWARDPGGMGGLSWVFRIDSVEKSENTYHISYTLLLNNNSAQEFTIDHPVTYYAIMEYKTFDGKGYWTIYKNSRDPLF